MRRLALVVVLASVAAACSGPTSVSTTATVISTTTTEPPTTAPPPPSTRPPGPNETLTSIGDPYYPGLGNGGYDVARYDIELTLLDGGEIAGFTTVTAVTVAELDRLSLDFGSTEPVGDGLVVDAVRVDGAPARWDHDGEELIVTPPAALAAGATFVVEVEYSGVPFAATSRALPIGVGWYEGASGVRYVIGEPDGAHLWFPANDHPSDKATFSISVTVPAGTFAAANGSLVDQIDDIGTTTFVWEEDDPMATYLATVVVSDRYTLVRDEAASAETGIEVRNVLASDLADDPPAPLGRTAEMVGVLSGLFGPYPFDEYGVAFVDGFGSALENQTLSLFDTELADAPILDLVLVHELAHQWFGNSLTPRRWEDIWLNEGFATFAELLWIEAEGGEEAYRDEIRERTRQVRAFGLGPPGSPAPSDLFAGGVYQRGALTLVALRDEVGDATFFDILRAYTDRYAYGNVTTADFVTVAEEVANRDLSALFDAWLYDDQLPD